MTPDTPPEIAPNRAFSVHPQLPGARTRIVQEASFEAAAAAYAEDLHTAPTGADEEEEVRLIVRDVETGQQHCFTVDLGDGGIGDCG